MPGTLAGADAFVHQAPQQRENLGSALHLVEDDERTALAFEITLGIHELAAVRVAFEVEIFLATGTRTGEGQRERRLADLPGTEEGDDGESRQRL